MHNNLETDGEWRKCEAWGSISGASLKGNIENSLSQSQRCFQVVSPSEQSQSQNYYGGTQMITPGPGSYIGRIDWRRCRFLHPHLFLVEPIFTADGSKIQFGISQRVLSNSNRLYAPDDLSVPPPGTYDINKSSRVDYLRNLQSGTQWKLKLLKSKMQDVDQTQKMSREQRDMVQEIKFLSKRLKALRHEIELSDAVSTANTAKFPSPTKPAFNTTSKKPHQETPKIQTAPTFYRSSQDWDFGSDKRYFSLRLQVTDITSP
jgi:hypothetical protein